MTSVHRRVLIYTFLLGCSILVATATKDTTAGNFAAVDQDANRGKLPGKKMPLEVLKEMEANAYRSGCVRGCLICLSHIKCTAKMKKFIPGRCHTYHGGALEQVVDMPEIPGFVDMEPMEQFMAQVDKCQYCTKTCITGLANIHCSDLLKKWFPQRCSQFADKIQSEVDTIKGLGGKLPGKKIPREVLVEFEANAKRSGCVRGCLICLSHIKCTAKMKKFIPGRCHTYHGGALEQVVDMPEIPGFVDMEPMEQFMAQVDKCQYCTKTCITGLANIHCSDLLKKWFPQRCSN